MMMKNRQHNLTILGLFLLISTMNVGCAQPPIEDIASAEAALQAARDAEAEKLAAEPFAEAEGLMTETYRLNDDKDYENTKIRAGETRDKADEARDLALRAKAQGGAEKPEDSEPADESDSTQGDGGRIDLNTPDETRAAIESETIGAGALDEGSRLDSLESIYFAFDRYTVSAAQMSRVEAVAEWLQANPSAAVKIEGHTDERGAADYNLALGARRADSVKQLLVTLGVGKNQLSTQSYGEESPENPEHDEAAWTENRRADFVIVQ